MNVQAAESSTGPGLFQQHGYVVVPGLIDAALVDFLASYIGTRFASRLLSNGDNFVPNTPSDYGDPAIEALLEYVRPQIERHTGLLLHPTYSYYRLYKHGDVLKRHLDRPACEISVTLNIAQTPAEPWPIYVKRDAGPYAALLQPGDALIYRGCDCAHWRDAYTGRQLAQVFLHYVDREGPYAAEKFDGRQTLMRPAVAKKTIVNGAQIESMESGQDA
ncbi:MAG TPA: hypothetical protein VG986_10975 [Pseudolabrys sp.]|nr:hypothetical protein [Pseudolabrys sp.]